MGQSTSAAVMEAVTAVTGVVMPTKDPLDAAGTCMFDDKALWLHAHALPILSPPVSHESSFASANGKRENAGSGPLVPGTKLRSCPRSCPRRS